MEVIRRRKIMPITDWEKFLEEGKREFNELVEMPTRQDSRFNYDFLRVIGVGGFGHIILGRNKVTNTNHAIKTFSKAEVVKGKLVNNVKREKRILQALNHPFCINLDAHFQDKTTIYLVLPFVQGGELYSYLKKEEKLTEDNAKFYSAQVLLALEYLHYNDAVYRDLKPENILLDTKGYTKLIDFGFCKIVKGRTYSICGTPGYLAPEAILSKGYGKTVDWWSFGVLLYELCSGRTPFEDRDPMRTFQNSTKGKYVCPSYFSYNLQHLVSNLLQVDVTRRFGNSKNGISEIKNHNWFDCIDWLPLVNGQLETPFVPEVRHAEDSRNYAEFGELDTGMLSGKYFGDVFDDF